MPSEAMMKENSPICVSVKPLSMATLRVCPVTSMPSVPKTIIPAMTTAARRSISLQYVVSTPGSTIIPTEMKKTAPKRFFTGCTTFSILSAAIVPARIDPMTKAPSSREKPQITEKTAIEKQSPIETISSVSSFR